MRNAFLPLSLVMAAVAPTHLPLAFSQVVSKLALVGVPIDPGETTVTVLLVFCELALVIVSLLIPPAAFALPQALTKVSLILRTILPSVLSIPVRVPIAVHSFV